ncbi:MAG: MBL fold metallo-hydrolase, partial [Bacteroidota bacterium]
AALQAQHQPTIYAHPFTQQKVQQGFHVLPYERFLFGKIKPTRAAIQPFPAAIETDRYTLTPIATPGHSSDHHVFLEKQQGWLFSGDLYVGVKIKYFRKGEDIGQQIASLEKVLQYDFDVLFCGHTPQRKGAKDCLSAKLHYFQDFYGTVLSYWQKGYPPRQIMRQMKRKEVYWLKLLTFNDVSLQHMMTSVIESEQRKKKA